MDHRGEARVACRTCGKDLGPDHCELNVVSRAWHRVTHLRCALYVRPPKVSPVRLDVILPKRRAAPRPEET